MYACIKIHYNLVIFKYYEGIMHETNTNDILCDESDPNDIVTTID